MIHRWFVVLRLAIFCALASCGSSGGFSGGSKKAPTVEKAPSCNPPCRIETAANNKAEKPGNSSDSSKETPRDNGDEEADLPPTNPMKKECRGIFVGGALFEGINPFLAGSYESFEWDFSGEYVTGVVTYQRNGALITPPVYLKLSFKSRANNELIYDNHEIQSTGNKPQNLSFTCETGRMVQKEVWNSGMQDVDRTFILRKN